MVVRRPARATSTVAEETGGVESDGVERAAEEEAGSSGINGGGGDWHERHRRQRRRPAE
jgi:hypothetical protein